MTDPIAERRTPTKPPTLWHENHGGFLLLFLGGIFLVGAAILKYRQSQFVPPRFPEGDLIATPGVTEAALDGRHEVTGDHLSIVVSGAANDEGMMMVAIYDSKESFQNPAQAVKREQLRITDGEAVWKIPLSELPEQLAITAYHDENADNALNRNQIGIPLERYGFSNEARGLTGPPEFDEAKIRRPEAGKKAMVYIR